MGERKKRVYYLWFDTIKDLNKQPIINLNYLANKNGCFPFTVRLMFKFLVVISTKQINAVFYFKRSLLSLIFIMLRLIRSNARLNLYFFSGLKFYK